MSDRILLDQVLDPFTLCLNEVSAQKLIEFEIAPPVQERLNEFADRAAESTLTPSERADYEALVNAADFIAILKSKAQRRLAGTVSA